MSMLGAIDGMQGALDYHISRHNLLTANLAHVDTPGYRSRELYRNDPFNKVLEVQMQATDGQHMGVTARPVDWRVRFDPNAPVGADGNSVSLDREAVKISANNLRYDALSNMVRGTLDAYLWAANDAR